MPVPPHNSTVGSNAVETTAVSSSSIYATEQASHRSFLTHRLTKKRMPSQMLSEANSCCTSAAPSVNAIPASSFSKQTLRTRQNSQMASYPLRSDLCSRMPTANTPSPKKLKSQPAFPVNGGYSLIPKIIGHITSKTVKTVLAFTKALSILNSTPVKSNSPCMR